ncbi:hypothetical protein Ancab_012336, partial [Ancistrocladus abbreviatus]
NELMFNKKKIGAGKLFEKIQALSYEWIPARGNNKVRSFNGEKIHDTYGCIWMVCVNALPVEAVECFVFLLAASDVVE